jgi:hypothetical protein
MSLLVATRVSSDGRTDCAEAEVNPRCEGVLLNTQGRTADVEFTRDEWTSLCNHLHNENGPNRYAMAFREHGATNYKRAKRMPVSQAIQWSWDSITSKTKDPMAFAPYSMNNRKQSRWGAMDFDAHDGEHERARSFAFAAFRELMASRLFVVLEMSGAGWHVWAVAKGFRPVGKWVKLLKAVAHSIGAPIRDGVCEIFPPDTLPENSKFGLPMRAPGSWNPRTGTVNRIYWQNLKTCAFAKDSKRPLTYKRKKFLSLPATGVATNGLYRRWKERWQGEFSITTSHTRNGKLCGLVGEVFHQVGHAMARRIVEEQFHSKAVETKATLPEHLESFCALWLGLHRKWLAGLTPAERKCLDNLHTENLRDAFRIVRSYSLLAAAKGEADFGIAAEDLGDRLGVSLQAGCDIRKGLAERGVIAQTAPCQCNQRAARFKWTCDHVCQTRGT